MDQKTCKRAAEEIASNPLLAGFDWKTIVDALIKYLPTMLGLCAMFASPKQVQRRSVQLLHEGKGPNKRQRNKMEQAGITDPDQQNKVWTAILIKGANVSETEASTVLKQHIMSDS